MIEPLLSSFSAELVKIAVGGISPYEIHLSPEERALNHYFEKGNYFLGPEGRRREKRRKEAEDKDLEERTGYKFKEAASKASSKAEKFHDSSDRDWARFEKDLNSKAFQKAMLIHPDTDGKLKKYVQNYGGQLKSKSVMAVAPSRTVKDQKYKIKVLPNGRLSCECKDWQYKHSVKKTDCDHIKAVRHLYKSGIVKAASPILKSLAKSVNAARRMEMASEAKRRGELAERGFRH